MQDGVLYEGMKVIVPVSVSPQTIAGVYSSHLEPDACLRRAHAVFFWLLEVWPAKSRNKLKPVKFAITF